MELDSPSYSVHPNRREQRIKQVVCVSGPEVYVAVLLLGIDCQEASPIGGQGTVVLFSHKYSMVPLPPEGVVKLAKVVGEPPAEMFWFDPIVPPLVMLLQVVASPETLALKCAT